MTKTISYTQCQVVSPRTNIGDLFLGSCVPALGYISDNLAFLFHNELILTEHLILLNITV